MSASKTAKLIDWAGVRLRMECADMAMEDALNPTGAAARKILEARAKALAKAPEAVARAPGLDVVAFTLGRETYAIETEFVREVAAFQDYTPLPGVPPFIAGVTNLRGHVLAVIDLRSFFNIAPQGVTDLARVVVLGGARAEFGVLADASAGQFQIPRTEIVPAAAVTGLRSAFITGTSMVAGSFTMILDAAKLLADPRFTINHRHDN